ncbi:MAG TPA: hypothetical protein PLJ78_05870, partial [Anaerolineae bacterium]|nr:hypothetical protein [Anaerolineae bacterium]
SIGDPPVYICFEGNVSSPLHALKRGSGDPLEALGGIGDPAVFICFEGNVSSPLHALKRGSGDPLEALAIRAYAPSSFRTVHPQACPV